MQVCEHEKVMDLDKTDREQQILYIFLEQDYAEKRQRRYHKTQQPGKIFKLRLGASIPHRVYLTVCLSVEGYI